MSAGIIPAGVALLAPVPLEHLISGATISEREGKVAFGSRAWEVFYRLKALLEGDGCDALIYASDDPQIGPPTVRWRADFLGFVESKNGAHPAGMKFRPPSTAAYADDNNGNWAVFWEVANLRKVPPDEWLPVPKLRGLGNQKHFQVSAIPRGPTLIEPI